MQRVPVFDLDGTLIDSDEALVAPFVALGIDRSRITFGHVLDEECDRLGIQVADYLAAYDDTAAQPFAGVTELLAGIGRWAVCSNKHALAGRAELDRLGWEPEVALFSDAFAGSKELGPVLDALALEPADILFVGDTAHDRRCAEAVGSPFAVAGWNRRATRAADDLVLERPGDLLAHLQT
jgi:HAD superfamily hydrolase (TIGR01549 family)